MIALLVFVGAGLGGVARYGVGTWVQGRTGMGFPWGTFSINVSGSFLVAGLYTFLEGTVAAPEWRLFLGVGVLGGYTTFSTFSYETIQLLRDGEWNRALLYSAGSVVLSLSAAAVGLAMTSAFLRKG
jgi:CrcB protein